MKKYILIGLIAAVAVLVIAGVGIAGFAYAQSQENPTPTPPSPGYGPGMMGGRGWFKGGMMGWRRTDTYGPMHTYMLEAMANALGLPPDDLQERLQNGETMWQVGESLGLTLEEFRLAMTDARAEALKKAVEDGIITQEQADWMSQHMAQMWASGACPGSGHCGGRGWKGW